MDILEFRFGQEVRSLTEALNHVEDRSRLRELLHRALQAASLEEFRQEMSAS